MDKPVWDLGEVNKNIYGLSTITKYNKSTRIIECVHTANI